MQKLKSEKFRLGCYVGDPNTSLSLSRGLGPLLDMAKQDRRLELVPAPANGADLNWSWLHSCDALFMEQPYTDQHVNCVYTARFLNLPVWLDWGDDLFNINKTNPALFQDHRLRDKAQLRENLGELFKCASVVSTATETLRQSYAKALDVAPEVTRGNPPPHVGGYLTKIVVIPEGCRWEQNMALRRKIVSWRGLSSHYDDIEGVAKQLAAVFTEREFADWKLLLFGDPSPEFIELMGTVLDKRLMVCPYLPTPWHMMAVWNENAPFLHLYPALDNAFNRAKPPSVWLEATAVGAAVIGPDFPEWQPCAGLIHYTEEFFGDRVRAELRKFEPVSAPSPAGEIVGKPHHGVIAARKQVFPHLTLESVNELRWAVVNKLIGGELRVEPVGRESQLSTETALSTREVA